MFTLILFYTFSSMLLLSASMVVLARNPVHAALFLILAFFFTAAIWLLLMAEFLAIVLILVYVGAVMVLFLFVVMLLDIDIVILREGFSNFFFPGIAVAGFVAILMGLVVNADFFDTTPFQVAAIHDEDYSNTRVLGQVLYSRYIYQFEIAGIILLVALVAAISLTMVKLRKNKSIHPGQPIQLDKQDRIRVIDMNVESGED